jgi:hypothetical protein
MDMMVVGVVAAAGLILGLIMGFVIKKPLTERPVVRIFSYGVFCTAAGALIGWLLAPIILSFV